MLAGVDVTKKKAKNDHMNPRSRFRYLLRTSETVRGGLAWGKGCQVVPNPPYTLSGNNMWAAKRGVNAEKLYIGNMHFAE